MSRRIVQVGPGVVRIEQQLRISRREIGTDATGPACIYAVVQVSRGTVAYLRGDTRIAAPARFAVLIPPFAIVQACLERCEVRTVGVAWRPRPSDRLPREPLLIVDDDGSHAVTGTDVFELPVRWWQAAGTAIGRASGPVLLAARAKATIDRGYMRPIAIGRVAARLGASPAVLSRMFKQAYGMPPVRYRHAVRTMDALTQFAAGAAPADVSQDVGFDDLSRFYKIFRKVACAAPGAYRPGKSKSAKT